MIQINDRGLNTSQNVIDSILDFNTSSTWTAIGTGSAFRFTEDYFNGNGCLKVLNSDYKNTDLFASNSTQSTVIPFDGVFDFSLYAKKDLAEDVTYSVEIYQTPSGGSASLIYSDSVVFSEDKVNEWTSFITNENFALSKNDVITFRFKLSKNESSSVTSTSVLFDGLHLYNKERNQLEAPIYSKSIYAPTSNDGGWIYIKDDNSGGTQTITTTPTKFTVNGLASATDIEDAPDGVTIWNTSTNKITPAKLRDNYSGEIDFNVDSRTGSPKYLNYVLDIGGLTTISIPIRSGRIEIDRTAPFLQSHQIKMFCKETFLTNGGQIFLSTDAGSCEINDKAIYLARIFKK